jgi:hypothetical protein|tara:strand:+ start:29101 stop:29277 length:177 start_codon:yes stop_codon:yes gene_type:complete
MSTITLYYCSICETLNKFFTKLIKACEQIGTARAAAELSRQGYHEQAKALILSVKEEK